MQHLISDAFRGEPILPSRTEFTAVQQLFVETLSARDAELPRLKEEWAKWELRLTAISLNGEAVLLLSEDPLSARGRGLYLFRGRRYNPLFLQAPHSRSDELTLEITAGLFADGRFRAAAWNTVHRSKLDVAHTEATYFQAFTAAAAAVPGATLAQLHGFDASSRDSSAGAGADLILSTGSERPPAWFAGVRPEFAQRLANHRVRLFPFDVQELGATTNVQADVFHGRSGTAFLHLECSKRLRENLENDAALRASLIAALEQVRERCCPIEDERAAPSSGGRDGRR